MRAIALERDFHCDIRFLTESAEKNEKERIGREGKKVGKESIVRRIASMPYFPSLCNFAPHTCEHGWYFTRTFRVSANILVRCIRTVYMGFESWVLGLMP